MKRAHGGNAPSNNDSKKTRLKAIVSVVPAAGAGETRTFNCDVYSSDSVEDVANRKKWRERHPFPSGARPLNCQAVRIKYEHTSRKIVSEVSVPADKWSSFIIRDEIASRLNLPTAALVWSGSTVDGVVRLSCKFLLEELPDEEANEEPEQDVQDSLEAQNYSSAAFPSNSSVPLLHHHANNVVDEPYALSLGAGSNGRDESAPTSPVHSPVHSPPKAPKRHRITEIVHSPNV